MQKAAPNTISTMDEYMKNFDAFLFRDALIEAIQDAESAPVQSVERTLKRVKDAFEKDGKAPLEPENYTLMDNPEHPSDPLCGYYFAIEWLMGMLEHNPELGMSSLADGTNRGIPSNIFFKSCPSADFIEWDVLDELFNGFYWNAASTLIQMMVEQGIAPKK